MPPCVLCCGVRRISVLSAVCRCHTEVGLVTLFKSTAVAPQLRVGVSEERRGHIHVYWYSSRGRDDEQTRFFFFFAVHTRALTSCCAVARAQHLGQNSRFAQQPPRGWLRTAHHAILCARCFSPAAKNNVARRFFAVGRRRGKKIGALFFEFAGGDFFFEACIFYNLSSNYTTVGCCTVIV